jgi:hypothetical protein
VVPIVVVVTYVYAVAGLVVVVVIVFEVVVVRVANSKVYILCACRKSWTPWMRKRLRSPRTTRKRRRCDAHMNLYMCLKYT